MNIFFFISEEFERSTAESIWDITVPIEQIKRYLQEVCQVEYKSSQWVYTQLKRYEDEVGVRLFRKESTGTDSKDFALGLYHPFVNFQQKQHLYVNQKIRVANGVYDKIKHSASERRHGGPMRLLLGAGSTIYHLAAIIAEKSWTDEMKFSVYTHNLGALQQLLNPRVNFHNVEVFTPQGRIDPTTYAIVGPSTPLFESVAFDYVVQGTSRVHKTDLYIESREEWERKKTILSGCTGQKILVLTKHEFAGKPFPGIESYGSITDYDWVVAPRRKSVSLPRKRYDLLFDECAPLFTPEIISWNYEILKVIKNDG